MGGFSFNKHNNIKNLKYENSNKIIFKSKRLTKHKINSKILFEDDNLILNDEQGNIIVYSIYKKIIDNFNFYKKNKKIDKKLVDCRKGIIYVSDNIGYVYAYNYKSKNFINKKS